MSGKADYRPTPGYENRLHFIGPAENPVWIGRKGDVPGLLSETFWEVYRAWQKANLGLGVPEPGTWIADAVAILEGQHRAYFSQSRQIVDRLDTLIRLMAGRQGRPK